MGEAFGFDALRGGDSSNIGKLTSRKFQSWARRRATCPVLENGEAGEATPPLSDGETRRLSLARWGDALELL